MKVARKRLKDAKRSTRKDARKRPKVNVQKSMKDARKRLKDAKRSTKIVLRSIKTAAKKKMM